MISYKRQYVGSIDISIRININTLFLCLWKGGVLFGRYARNDEGRAKTE